jgi:hypothetical protein
VEFLVAVRRAKAEATRDTLVAYRIVALHWQTRAKKGRMPPLRSLLPDLPSTARAQTPRQMMRALRIIAAQHHLPFPVKES